MLPLPGPIRSLLPLLTNLSVAFESFVFSDGFTVLEGGSTVLEDGTTVTTLVELLKLAASEAVKLAVVELR